MRSLFSEFSVIVVFGCLLRMVVHVHYFLQTRMGDDGLTATELRQRYHKGGSVPDSDLSASQLRGRYGIQNTKSRLLSWEVFIM